MRGGSGVIPPDPESVASGAALHLRAIGAKLEQPCATQLEEPGAGRWQRQQGSLSPWGR